MAENEVLLFKDPLVRPNDKSLFSILGDKSRLWLGIMEHMRHHYPDAAGEWRYYNDGKQWLFKMNRKKNTVFWIVALEDTFRITFYFGDKAEPWIEKSALPEPMKRDFKSAKRYGKIRGISIKMADEKDVDSVKKLVELKVQASKH